MAIPCDTRRGGDAVAALNSRADGKRAGFHVGVRASLAVAVLGAIAAMTPTASAQVERIWLTHRSTSPDRIVVNWQSPSPGDSVVTFRAGDDPARVVSETGPALLHHVEIPLAARDVVYRYTVATDGATSRPCCFQGYPTRELRVAVVADWGFGPRGLPGLVRDRPHLLLTAGDNVPDLHSYPGATATNRATAFERLIDSAPELFRSTPFMPALGNHDRELRPRGARPPADPVYDVEARDFLGFFPLPSPGWTWWFDVPPFEVRFVAVDLSHLSDQGTTWQTCHSPAADSDQFAWYRSVMERADAAFVVTLMNERLATVRGIAGGAWGRCLSRGTLAVTGFGHFLERMEPEGWGAYNVSLDGKGTPYRDPNSKFMAAEDGYLLLTLRAGDTNLTAELKSVDGVVLDRRAWPRRAAWIAKTASSLR